MNIESNEYESEVSEEAEPETELPSNHEDSKDVKSDSTAESSPLVESNKKQLVMNAKYSKV